MVMRGSCEIRNNKEVQNRSELKLKTDIKEWKILCSEGKVKKHGNYLSTKLKIQQ